VRRKIYYFTNSFPYGIGENWKLYELEILSHFFSEIEIIPNNYAGNSDPRKLSINNVQVSEPLFKNTTQSVKLKDFFRLFLSPDALFFLFEFFRKSVYLKKSKVISFLNDSIKSLELKKHKTIQRIVSEQKPGDVFYFFWGRGTCSFVPLFNKQIYAEIFIRFHRYDLYECINNGYIPFRIPLFKRASRLIVISDNGKDYLTKKYPSFQDKIVVNRLGTLSKGVARASEDGVLRIFSCSSLTTEKRVTLLAKSVQFLRIRVEWTHIGDGPLQKEVKKITDNFAVNIKFNLTGWLRADEVLDLYIGKRCDLFINVSSTEGIPVSIMEAFSAGIPAFATNVGGVKEIVDSKNGKLLDCDIQPGQLADIIENFYNQSQKVKENLRQSAFKTFAESYDAHVNATKLASLFISGTNHKV
jgi:glycosyltransferase involved in cell wall biosynthesis